MTPLHSLAPLRFIGADARSFLQGQLSHDLQLLSARRSLLTCLNSPQGRVQSVLRLIQRGDDIVALLPRVMVDLVLPRLRKYLLRSKLAIVDARDELQVFSASADDVAERAWPLPDHLGEHLLLDSASLLRWPDAQFTRVLVLQEGVSSAPEPATEQRWMLADIRAGLPQVLPETHESFVAQMLNLDVLDGISLNKGCYTGQEIIARAHFRGMVKRRMFHLLASRAAPPPGARIVAGSEPAGEVVMAADTEAGCELLGVIGLMYAAAALTLEDGTPLQMGVLPYAIPASS